VGGYIYIYIHTVLALALMMQLSCNRNDSSVSNTFQLIHYFSPSAESFPDFVTAFREDRRGHLGARKVAFLLSAYCWLATDYLGRTLGIVIQVNQKELCTFASCVLLAHKSYSYLVDCFSLEFRYEGSDD
jgi:hypothetical protein